MPEKDKQDNPYDTWINLVSVLPIETIFTAVAYFFLMRQIQDKTISGIAGVIPDLGGTAIDALQLYNDSGPGIKLGALAHLAFEGSEFLAIAKEQAAELLDTGSYDAEKAKEHPLETAGGILWSTIKLVTGI